VADHPTNLPNPGTGDSSGQKSASNTSDRLESWKEIAAYLKREVRTVQRWEKNEGLPVHRHQHDERSTVYAFKTEFDAWWGTGHFRLSKTNGKQERPEEEPAKGPIGKALEWLAGSRRHLRLWLAGAAVAVAAAAAFYVLRPSPVTRSSLQSKGSMLIADFENRTGDPVFDGTLRQGLAAQLDQSPFLYIFSDEQIGSQLRLMDQPAGTRLTSGLAQEVCQRMGGAAVLEGSIARIGSEYDLVLEALNCSTGVSLARAEARATDKSHVLDALGTVAASMREKLGESLASIRKFNKPLADVTTPSLEALKAYSLGSKELLAQSIDAAIASFQHAVSLDPNFAMAYAKLGAASKDYESNTLAARYLRKAYALRDRVSEHERFYISSHYFHLAQGNLPKARSVYELWARTYPRDKVPFGDLGVLYPALGQYGKAIAALRHAVSIPPADAMNYGNLIHCYIDLDRPDEAATALAEARARGTDSPGFHLTAGAIDFLQGNTAAVAREEALIAGTPVIDAISLSYQTEGAAFAGHLSKERRFSARAVARARQEGNKWYAAVFQATAAVNEAMAGNPARARRLAMASLRISHNRDTVAIAAITLALAGDVPHSRRLTGELAKRFPEDTIVQSEYLPTIRAAIALDEKNPRRAIADLHAASAYELGDETPNVKLYPAYVRGMAFLAKHQGPQAAAEFQKVLDHPGLAIAEIIVPLSHLGIARARAIEGDKAGARKAYQDFFTLWRHADPDIPMLGQARVEYARLR
jgi:tetratricopeptide (TPR) repeat protein